MIARDFAPAEKRIPSLRQRLEKIPGVIAQAKANLQHPPRIHGETAVVCQNVLTGYTPGILDGLDGSVFGEGRARFRRCGLERVSRQQFQRDVSSCSKRLEIADQMKGNSRMIPAEPVGEVVALGEAEIGFQQISELKLVSGIEIVGALPDELQKITTFSAGTFSATTRPAAAGLLISALATPEVAAVMRKQGMEPVAAVR